MPDHKVRNGGAWVDPTAIYAKVSGVWTDVQSVHARQGGVWTEVWANAFNATITTNQQDLNLRNWALANGWDGSTAATITIDTGVEITATTVLNAALTIDGSWPGGITLINNGSIVGKGGQGGGGGVMWAGTVASPSCPSSYKSAFIPQTDGEQGGDAIEALTDCSIDNTNGLIGGGGGGGGGGGTAFAGAPPGICGPPPVASGSAGGAGGGGAGYGSKGVYNKFTADQGPGSSNPTVGCLGQGYKYAANDDATAGTLTSGGVGGTDHPTAILGCNTPVEGGHGGVGGALGQPGTDGTVDGTHDPKSSGGAAGHSYHENLATITWIAEGDLRGPARTTMA